MAERRFTRSDLITWAVAGSTALLTADTRQGFSGFAIEGDPLYDQFLREYLALENGRSIIDVSYQDTRIGGNWSRIPEVRSIELPTQIAVGCRPLVAANSGLELAYTVLTANTAHSEGSPLRTNAWNIWAIAKGPVQELVIPNKSLSTDDVGGNILGISFDVTVKTRGGLYLRKLAPSGRREYEVIRKAA